MTSVSRSTHVKASPQTVFDLVSDLPGMGRLSPENTGGRWTGGASGPAVGARFKGSNARGSRRWSTAVTVVRCEAPSTFAFAVSVAGMPVATWTYAITPDGDGCSVTETWDDARNALVKVLGGVVSGVADREAWTATSIEQTLAALKARAEAH